VSEVMMEKLSFETLIPRAAELFSVLSEDTRLRILISILNREKSVSEIVNEIGISQSAISHQLRHLRQLGIVRYRRSGKNILYALDDNHVRNILIQVFEHVAHKSVEYDETLWRENNEAQK